MRVDLTGAKEIRDAFAALVPRVQEKALARLATAVHQDVRDGADAHTQTGALFQSVRLARDSDGWRIFHDPKRAPYAPFVHWGTRPHEIRPKNRKALRWPSGNGFVFAKWAKHPGYEGDPWMLRALDNAPRHFARIVTELQRNP